MDDARFTIPLYTAGAVARYLGMGVQRLRYWAGKDGLLTVRRPETPRGATLPFIALVEAQLYRTFLSNGLSLQAIALGMKAVREQLGDEMLKEGKLAYDGKSILMNLAQENNSFEWIRAHDQQTTIPKIVDEGLRLITWDNQHYPESVRLTEYGESDVVADYRYAFGQPIIRGTRTRVDDVIQLFKAGESFKNIGDELAIDTRIVESIIRPHVAFAA
jgi:uncharacterized protein (DUF433 family)